jgi:hypothetical protein
VYESVNLLKQIPEGGGGGGGGGGDLKENDNITFLFSHLKELL